MSVQTYASKNGVRVAVSQTTHRRGEGDLYGYQIIVAILLLSLTLTKMLYAEGRCILATDTASP